MFNEFKKFIMRGNVMDMAIGIILGVAFGKIITSFVSDVLMPPIGLLLGHVDFSQFAIVLKAKTATSPAVLIQYGVFINTLIDFLIIAFVIFIVVKQTNKLKSKKEPEATTKTCPKCISEINIKATRCSHCTVDLAP